MLKPTVLLTMAAMFTATVAQAGSLNDVTLYTTSAGGTVAGDYSTSGPGYGVSSWQNASLSAAAKGEVYIPVGLLFSGPVTISDIQSISYMTNNPTAGIVNWSLYLYTNPSGTGDSAGWYRSRLTAEPYFAPGYVNTEAQDNWITWSTGDPSQPLRLYDGNRMGTGTANNYQGGYADPFFGDLLGGPVGVNGGTWITGRRR